MTRLLVSVRDADEAQSALLGGADVIDVKEPLHGSLGRASSGAVRDVLRHVSGRAPVSAALGELSEFDDDPTFDRLAAFFHECGRDAPSLAFAKLGLSSYGVRADWAERWHRSLAVFPESTQPVAVIYADWSAAGSPCPESILSAALPTRCRMLLVDTHSKASGALFSHWPSAALTVFLALAHSHGFSTALAGSLTLADFPLALSLSPTLLAVRGAACVSDRTSSICAERVSQLKALVGLGSQAGVPG